MLYGTTLRNDTQSFGTCTKVDYKIEIEKLAVDFIAVKLPQLDYTASSDQ
jgi:hypothetical protein